MLPAASCILGPEGCSVTVCPFSRVLQQPGIGDKFFLCHDAAVVALKGSSLCESFSLSSANVLWWNLVLSFINSPLVL